MGDPHVATDAVVDDSAARRLYRTVHSRITKMRLLLLYPRLPYPPHKGDKIRTYHQFTYLTERHEVWCACFVDDRADWQHVQRCVHRCRGFAAIRLSSIAGLASGAVSMCAGRSVTALAKRRCPGLPRQSQSRYQVLKAALPEGRTVGPKG